MIQPTPNVGDGGSQLAVLLGLTGFAISQPLLSLAGANPTLFVFNDVGRASIVIGALIIALVVPAAIWLAVRAVDRISPPLGGLAFLGVCGLLLTLAGVQWGRELSLGVLSYGFGLLVGGLGVAAMIRVEAVVVWLRYTAILPFLALGLFLFASETSDLLRSPSSVERNQIAGVEPTVVVILFDELPTATLLADDGTIDAEAFPNFHRLAGGSTWYRNFTTMSATTRTAVPAMLSGSIPRSAQPLWTNYPDNVFSLLAPTHGLTVDESFTQLCGFTACTTAGPGQVAESSEQLDAATDQLFDLWFDRIRGVSGVSAELDDFEEIASDQAEIEGGDIGEALFPDDETVRRNPQRLTDFVESIVPSEDPHLYFLHLVLPHIPFRWFPDGTQYGSEPDPFVIAGNIRSIEWIALVDEQRHLLQAQYTDRLLGVILDRLESQGMHDETALVVAADHGLSFALDEGRRSLGEAGRAGTAFVPLFTKEPGQTDGRVDDQNLMTPDFLPVIADIVGVEIPFEVDGAGPGSPEIADRGDAKFYLPGDEELASAQLGDPVSYDAVDYAPTSDDRRLDPAKPSDPQIGSLLAQLDSAELIGTAIDDHAVESGASVRVLALDEVTSPADGAVMAFVQGTVVDGPTDGELLVEADGIVVSGSKIFQSGDSSMFLALLPPDVAGRGFDLRIALTSGDGRMIEAEIQS